MERAGLVAAQLASSQLKSKVGLALAKAAALRITLNLGGSPNISKSHTHPSHSETSRLLTSSLRDVTGPFPVSPVPVLPGEVPHRYRI